MKSIILLISLILLGCAKKQTKPSNVAQTTQDVKTVCWYQMFNGNKTFYRCTTTQEEYNQVSTYCATNQMNMSVKQSINCNCQ
jgi:hypothetical protein